MSDQDTRELADYMASDQFLEDWSSFCQEGRRERGRLRAIGTVGIMLSVLLVTSIGWWGAWQSSQRAAAEKSQLDAEVRGVIRGFIGSAEAHVSDGNYTEAGDLIAGMQSLHEEIGSTRQSDESIRERLKGASLDLVRGLLNEYGTASPESIDEAMEILRIDAASHNNTN